MDQITQVLLRRKIKIIKIFWIITLLWMMFVFILAVVPGGRYYWLRFGHLSGELAIIMFSIAMIPGILKRLQLQVGIIQSIRIILMAYRRQLGISMFLFAFSHYMLVKIFPSIAYKIPLTRIDLFEVFGIISLYAALPLFLTSNDQSVKKLGKNWHKIHRLVYLISWTIFLHVVLLKGLLEPITLLILAIAILEVISWINFWQNKPAVVNS